MITTILIIIFCIPVCYAFYLYGENSDLESRYLLAAKLYEAEMKNLKELYEAEIHQLKADIESDIEKAIEQAEEEAYDRGFSYGRYGRIDSDD
jgi:hypothetical protein